MPKREVIDTAHAPHTGLPYAQAIRYGDLVFVAGQVALDPKTNQPSGGDVAAQTRRVLDNISAILEEAGTSLAQRSTRSSFCARHPTSTRSTTRTVPISRRTGRRAPRCRPRCR